jgi:two-component system sensor kinase FixL
VNDTQKALAGMSSADAEKHLAALLDAAVNAIIIINGKGIIEFCNAATESLFGYAQGELSGKSVNILMPAQEGRAHDRHIQHYLHTGEARIIGIGRESVAERKDGSQFPIDLSVGRVSGDEPRFVGIIRDISATKKAEAALTLERDRSQSYLEVAGVMLLVLGQDGCIELINRYGCEILGRDEEDLLGEPWVEGFILEDKRSEVARVFKHIIEHGIEGYESVEGSVVTDSGETRLIAWQNRALRDKNNEIIGTLSSGTDITDQRQADIEAEITRQRLAQVSRVTTLGEMAAGLAHEINQPLTAISTFAQGCQRMLEASSSGDSDFKDALKQISTQAQRAGKVIHRMRNFVRYQDSERNEVDMVELINDLNVLVEMDARRNDITLVYDIAEKIPLVMADPVQIQQVVLNLVRNAVDACGECAGRAHQITIRCLSPNPETVRVEVSDTATGVPEDMADDLFTQFFTSKKDGIGLGLSISHTIIDAHGGALSFRNNADVGAVFFFDLPTAIEELESNERQ